MADFLISIEKTLKNEGGYVHDPEDPGGETNYGITKATALRHGYTGDMKDLSVAEAIRIYKEGYWNTLGLTQCESQPLADMLFDLGVLFGTGRIASYLQRSLNVLNRQGKDWPDIKVDGIIGKQSLYALNTAIEKGRQENIKKCVYILAGSAVFKDTEKNPKLEKFFNGWLQLRINFK